MLGVVFLLSAIWFWMRLSEANDAARWDALERDAAEVTDLERCQAAQVLISRVPEFSRDLEMVEQARSCDRE